MINHLWSNVNKIFQKVPVGKHISINKESGFQKVTDSYTLCPFKSISIRSNSSSDSGKRIFDWLTSIRSAFSPFLVSSLLKEIRSARETANPFPTWAIDLEKMPKYILTLSLYNNSAGMKDGRIPPTFARISSPE